MLLPPLVGGVCAVAVGLLLREVIDGKLLAEIVVDASSDTLQPRGFAFLLEKLGPVGKPLLFTSVILGELALYVVVWQLLALRTKVVFAAGAAWLALMVATAALIVLTKAQLGSHTTWLEYGLLTAARCAVFGVVATTTMITLLPTREPEPATAGAEAPSRRRFLGALPILTAGLALYIVARQVLKTSHGGVQSSGPTGDPTPEITPNENFYLVSKNLFDPTVDAGSWRLRVGGEAENMLEFTYDEIKALPSREQYTTLQCISNEVGGDLISNALWRGFPLKDLLDMAQPRPGANFVAFKAADDFTQCLPLDFVMNESVMLVWQMNGETLPSKHGYPLRMIAPGKYGFKGPKWITEIALSSKETLGYWEQRGWDEVGRMNTSTRIDVPYVHTSIESLPYRIHGIAFSGNRGISKVEVSLDDGTTWADATLKPALSPYTWVLWYYDITSKPAAKNLNIVARATDGDGQVQTKQVADPYPSGATGYPHASATVSDSA